MKSSSIILLMGFSFPGIGLAEMITVSPGTISICLCVATAIRVNADIGSPWLPVVITTSCSGGYLSISSMSMRVFSVCFIYPVCNATSITFTILLPQMTHFLLNLTAVSMICWTLWILEENVATIRRPVVLEKISSNVAPTVLSDMVKPFLSAFVLSAIKSKTPFSPSSAKRIRSIGAPSIGV